MDKYHGDEPYSYGGKYRLYEYFGKRKVNDIISKSDIYTSFKQYKKPRKYYPLYLYSRFDLVFFANKDMF